MLSLTKKHRTATPRVPDCILILIHWLLSTSLQWEPNCNKHLNIRNHLGGLCDQAENSNLHGTVWIPHTKPPSRSSVIWLQQEMTELYSEWFRNITLLVLIWRATPTIALLSAHHPQFPYTLLSVGDFCRFPSFCPSSLNGSTQRHLHFLAHAKVYFLKVTSLMCPMHSTSQM